MLYVSVKQRAVIAPGQTLRLRDVADLFCDGEDDLSQLAVPCPGAQGVWRIASLAVAEAILRARPGTALSFQGADACYVRVVAPEKRSRTHILRAALAFALLTLGSAMAILWFHADVNMAEAQANLFALLAGAPPENPLYIALPYTAGVGLGVALFYALLGKKHTVSPLVIKLQEYRAAAERAEGKTP